MTNSETSREDPYDRNGTRMRFGRIAPGRTAMWLLAKSLHRVIRTGRLTLFDSRGEKWCFGPGAGPAVSIRLTDKRLPGRLLVNPTLALGEAYMDGTLRIEAGSLRDLLSICTTDMDTVDALPGKRLIQVLDALQNRRLHHNPVSRSRTNVAHHYDLSTELYDLFLDADR